MPLPVRREAEHQGRPVTRLPKPPASQVKTRGGSGKPSRSVCGSGEGRSAWIGGERNRGCRCAGGSDRLAGKMPDFRGGCVRGRQVRIRALFNADRAIEVIARVAFVIVLNADQLRAEQREQRECQHRHGRKRLPAPAGRRIPLALRFGNHFGVSCVPRFGHGFMARAATMPRSLAIFRPQSRRARCPRVSGPAIPPRYSWKGKTVYS